MESSIAHHFRFKNLILILILINGSLAILGPFFIPDWYYRYCQILLIAYAFKLAFETFTHCYSYS